MPLIYPTRVVAGLDPIWDDWLETGLVSARTGGPGFRSAGHALTAIEPARSMPTVMQRSVGGMRTVLRGLLVGT